MLNLKPIRMAKKMGVTELAKKVGVSCVCIWRWETGLRSPSVKMLTALAAALDVTPNELLGVGKEGTE